ncbi:G-type lectin S-receptor-like serine/threonine-protein kinase LECRK4 [Cornus florida]|uniref:G-type lectin S-receptor-like serine/threonine-protein kinase LECRK4 n=1 Tax=Cornus florida TaxID=4283 RepID=UPI0028970F12|nr:G-type lectin S-receptor-like serine/threonine-protein kinase LECRK4 [Cornus florida]
MGSDGLWRLYSYSSNQNGNWTIEWSAPDDRCSIKGMCGINGFFVLMDQEPSCTCPPGFVYINQGQKNLGCNKNFSTESCVFKYGNINYTIYELDNTMWEDSVYFTYLSMTKEDCKQACLDDCSCEPTTFQNQECRTQKLPLRFGKRKVDDSTGTLVKVGTRGSTGRNETPTVTNRVPKSSKKGQRMDILIIATSGFKEILGQGAFGTIFKGVLSDRQKAIAVKRLEKVVAEEDIEFRNEMRAIGRTNHRNLVRLLGYCHEGSNRLLVYKYMSNSSLANFLFKSEVQPNWDRRIQNALDMAKGILYLHEECNRQIVHCDINPKNILMVEHCRVKIADFGLAKLLMPEQTRTFTGSFKGTRGYVAPEYYGIVFLEIICCRKCVDINFAQNEAVLADWVYTCFKENELRKLVREEEVDEQQLERMVRIGLWCIHDEPSLRPSMKKVVLML